MFVLCPLASLPTVCRGFWCIRDSGHFRMAVSLYSGAFRGDACETNCVCGKVPLKPRGSPSASLLLVGWGEPRAPPVDCLTSDPHQSA